MQTCFEIPESSAEYGIKLEQLNSGRFRVTYGLQVKTGLTYSDAATELGAAIMHQAACNGLLDNDVK
jgi:hypothetical protein